ncbi:Paraquat-inducible protein A [Rhodovastum atsumiense]|uniref:paraquat-inducible protein A n=1 Tax=Rhodovastum atsumiense TaxID=504468 RepID=UPI001EF061AC|nr:paraquat-inducible protein A [Rhodovastum atsumiense]CAH2601622.1 Paraquat-inducible protein A [Rhodovastum atsumiense]
MPTISSRSPTARPEAAPAGTCLRECPDCGLFLRLPALDRGTVARCPRCAAVLRRHRTDPQGRALAFAVTGLLLLALATQMPFLSLDIAGRAQATVLLSGPEALEGQGLWELALVVLATTVIVPLAKLLCLAWVLVGLRLRRPPRHLSAVFRWVERLTPWAMVEVFMLGLFVAYTKLVDLAHVELGAAVYALGGLMLAMAAADAVLDHEQIWEAIARRTAQASPPAPPSAGGPGHPGLRRIGCHTCGLVCRAPEAAPCPRCGGRLHARKPHPLSRTWALVIAATILYIPANLLPVMTVINFGQGAPDTILSGVEELAAAGMWPLAALVFFASITVPVLKLASLVWLLISTGRGQATRLRERTLLFRIVDAVGRWSMIDVFMVSILTAIVRLGAIASVVPGPGVLAFCAVVILTMLAAETFDPRLMWDVAARRDGTGREAA